MCFEGAPCRVPACPRLCTSIGALVEEGLLEVEYRQLTGRTSPGAGRPSKLYRRAERQASVSLPQRRYDLAGAVLAAAVEWSAREGTPIYEAVQQVAHATGSGSRVTRLLLAGPSRAASSVSSSACSATPATSPDWSTTTCV